MNELMKKTTVCVFLVLATGICSIADSAPDNSVRGQASSPQGEQAAIQSALSKVKGTADIGREDPFAGAFGGAASEQQSNIPVVLDSTQPKPPLFVRTVTLKFLNAANLKVALDKMSSIHGSIGVDDNTNSIIICDTKENLENILAETKKADQTPPQIMIEVVIIDVQLKDDTEIGVDWDFLNTRKKPVSYRQGLVYPDRLSAVAPDSEAINTGTGFMTLGLGGELSLINDDIRIVVHLLQQKRNVDILASPRVMVVSGQKAEIKTVEEIPYQERTDTSGGGQLTSTQFKDIGVTMEVKATVTDDGKILLVIKPEQSVSTGMSIGGVPIVDKRGASTTLLMDDGQIAVMGGLRRQETQIIKNKIPLLGDLPLIGFIFSDNRKIVENSELLVLLSPHIYKDERVAPEAMARYNQITGKSLLLQSGEPNSQSPVEIRRQPKE